MASILGLVYINLLPNVKQSDTLILSCIHLILFLWAILRFAFIGERYTNKQQRLAFLKNNGDLVVMTTLIYCGRHHDWDNNWFILIDRF